MQREIIKIGEGLLTDHINHNSLDNRKANLRPATPTQSNRNRRKFSGSSNSKYKGVYWKKHIKKWVAQIGINTVLRKRYNLCRSCKSCPEQFKCASMARTDRRIYGPG
jgi:hypothetical protein